MADGINTTAYSNVAPVPLHGSTISTNEVPLALVEYPLVFWSLARANLAFHPHGVDK